MREIVQAREDAQAYEELQRNEGLKKITVASIEKLAEFLPQGTIS